MDGELILGVLDQLTDELVDEQELQIPQLGESSA